MEDPHASGHSIRNAALSDLNPILRLATQLGYPTSARSMRPRMQQILTQADHKVWVAVEPTGEIVGWVHVYLRNLLISDPHAALGGIVVREGHRRQGIGRALLEAAEAWAHEKGCSVLRANTNVLRQGSQAFYNGMGYTLQKTQDVYLKRLDESD